VTYKDFESYCKNFCGELWPLINCTDYNRCRKTFSDSRRGMVPLDEVKDMLIEERCRCGYNGRLWDAFHALKDRYGVRDETNI